VIRAAVDADLPVLQDIERAAGEAFHAVGMPEIADDEPLPTAVLAAYAEAGRAWVAVDADDRPVAYLIADVLDGNLHIEQVSVHPRAARRGIGRGLIEHAAAYARAHGLAALTLTTFTDVPWNAPYYERCGFRLLPNPGPALKALIQAESAHGLNRWPRVAMHRP
jgi:GNAT superfamily N-acetyltransferase